eukprot:316435_1
MHQNNNKKNIVFINAPNKNPGFVQAPSFSLDSSNKRNIDNNNSMIMMNAIIGDEDNINNILPVIPSVQVSTPYAPEEEEENEFSKESENDYIVTGGGTAEGNKENDGENQQIIEKERN